MEFEHLYFVLCIGEKLITVTIFLWLHFHPVILWLLSFIAFVCQKPENYEDNEASKPDDEKANNTAEIREKGNQCLSSRSNLGGKLGKEETEGSDPPEEGYIHVRARRGQATNSHSLAERVVTILSINLFASCIDIQF